MRTQLAIAATLSAAMISPLAGQVAYPEPLAIPQVRAFLGDEGLGSAHGQAPPELAQFGRLVGIWEASQKIRAMDGSWGEATPALWIWKYALDGFATQDLWIHTADHLPDYLQALRRPYMLTGLRIFEVSSGQWRVAWAANGAGKSPGADFGTFTAQERDGDVVMTDVSAFGHQRVTFSDITESSFTWSSEYSQDGDQWMEVMRVEARRRE